MKRIAADISGGCQCGAVRYHARAMLDNAHICHCRMCQKAVGNVFAAMVAAPRDALTWTRGTPAGFLSSDQVTRGYCRDCGTPLFYDFMGGDRVNLTIGSLDHPDRFRPRIQSSVEGRMPWFGDLCSLPESGTTDDDMPDKVAAIRLSNR